MNYLQKKKLAFMSIVNQIKGFIMTISGAFPLTLTDCVDNKSITNYSIYGNSMQDGVPTPDAPIEVESVGEPTKNLWDGSFANLGITGSNERYYFIENVNYKCIYVAVQEGKTYSISRDKISSSRFRYTFTSELPAKDITCMNYNNSFDNISQITNLVAPIGAKYLVVYLTNSNEDVSNTKYQIEESKTVTEYEPYGYKIPITVSGKNLFNIDDDFESKIVAHVNNYFNYEIQLKPNTTYAVSVTENNQNEYIVISNGITYNSSGISQIWISHVTNDYLTLKPNQSRSFTTTDNGMIYLCVLCGDPAIYKQTLTNCINGLQIEEGSTATDYEPYHESISTNIYLDEPLRKVGDYADYIDFENGKVIRQVLEESFDGSEGWYLWETALNNHVKYALGNVTPILNGGGNIKVLSNMFMHSTTYEKDTMNAYRFLDIKGWIAATVDVEMFPNVEDFKNFLSTQSNVNKPLKVYFAMPKKETPLTLPIIPTFKGTSIISVDTTIQPSNAEIEYYSNAKER